jgi:trk system potassium uptake protein TrkH
VLLFNAAFMVVGAAVSFFVGTGGTNGAAGIGAGAGTGTGVDTWALLGAAAIAAAIALVPVLTFPRDKDISNKEGFSIVVGAWLASCVVGMLPYLLWDGLWGGPFDLSKAWYESVSGFTTTGSTIIGNVEAMPAGLLFWRSCTHWIGGAGVVMFAMLIMPLLGRSRMMVSHVEMSSLARDDYKYTSTKIIRILLTVYLGLTGACCLLLKVAGMGWFDAVNHAMSTVATGGFSTRAMSLASWDSAWIEGVTIFFMAVAGIHFGVIFSTLTGRRNNVFRSEVVRYWMFCLVAITLVVAASVTANGTYGFGEALRFASFQTVSTATTTGFVTADANLWGPLSMVVLTMAGIQCACAGSTSGGLKADRVWLAMKVLRHQIRQQQHPNAVIRIKMNGVTQESSALGFTILFMVAYFFLLGLGTVVFSVWGYDAVSAFSMTVSSLGNVGTGFGAAGGFSGADHLPAGLMWFSTLLMLLGRLEIFGLLQLFMIRWWR